MDRPITIIGAGSLGLGLLAPLSAACGHPPEFVCRQEREPGYRAAIHSSQRAWLQTRRAQVEETFNSLVEYDDRDSGHSSWVPCVERVSSSTVVLVSVRPSNFGAVAELLARACESGGTDPLHVLAFENMPRASTTLVGQALKILAKRHGRDMDRLRPLLPHDTIADRVCLDPLVVGGEVRLPIEEYGHVVIAESAKSLLNVVRTAAPLVPTVQFVSTDLLSEYERRKFWFVNGTHVALGTLAATANTHLLAETIRVPSLLELVERLHNEWITVLAAKAGTASADFSASALSKYAQEVRERVLNGPDIGVDHVLAELVEILEPEIPRPKRDRQEGPLPETLYRPRVARLMAKLEGRLAEPILLASASQRDSMASSAYVLARSVQLVCQCVNGTRIGGK